MTSEYLLTSSRQGNLKDDSGDMEISSEFPGPCESACLIFCKFSSSQRWCNYRAAKQAFWRTLEIQSGSRFVLLGTILGSQQTMCLYFKVTLNISTYTTSTVSFCSIKKTIRPIYKGISIFVFFSHNNSCAHACLYITFRSQYWL